MRHVLISTFFDHEINCFELTLPFMPLVLSLQISDTAASENHSTSSCHLIKKRKYTSDNYQTSDVAFFL